MYWQYHLKGKYHSGRAIKVQQLSDVDVARNQLDAGKLIGKDATMYELKKAEYKGGIKRFLVAISEPVTAVDANTKFKKITVADLDDLSEYFTAKDISFLEALYRDFHEVMQSDMDAITGEAVPVAEA